MQCKSSLQFFSRKWWLFCVQYFLNFSISLTNTSLVLPRLWVYSQCCLSSSELGSYRWLNFSLHKQSVDTAFHDHLTFYLDMTKILLKRTKKKLILSICHILQLYSCLSLSRLRLSQITAYLKEKIWFLFKNKNLTSGSKILWIKGEIAP